MSGKNQDFQNLAENDMTGKELQEEQEEPPKNKKTINLSQEERLKRSERMKLLRAKLDNISNKKPEEKIEEPKKSTSKPVKKEKIIKKVESESSEEEEEEEEEPPKKIKKQDPKQKQKPKQTPRKVLKIKYYHEPSQAELLHDRIFLENQEKFDHEISMMKNKEKEKEEKPKRDINDISHKLFNY